MTDKVSCTKSVPNSLGARSIGFDDDHSVVISSGVKAVSTPLQMPAVSSGMLRREAMMAIYLSGILLQAKTYREATTPTVSPFQSTTPDETALEAFAGPKANNCFVASLSAHRLRCTWGPNSQIRAPSLSKEA